MFVAMGNTAAVEIRDGQRLSLPGNRVTSVLLPDEPYTTGELIATVTAPDGIWANHSDEPAPAWVEADDATFAALLARAFGPDVPVGRPDDWTTDDDAAPVPDGD